MAGTRYQYTTSPRKLEPDVQRKRHKKQHNLKVVEDVPRQKVKVSKEQKRRQKNLTLIVILLLTISYRNSKIN